MDGILKLLWTSGNALESGGAVSASLAIMLVLLVKKVLAHNAFGGCYCGDGRVDNRYAKHAA